MKARTVVHAAALAALGLGLAAGCGDDGMGRRYPVSGRVTYRGEPLTKGTVNFIPVDPMNGRPAGGEIGADGTYRLTTHTPDDGALAGRYRVCISAVEVDMSKVKLVSTGIPRHDQLSKAPRKTLIPAKYGDPATSNLKAEVDPRSNTRDFDLN